MPDILLTFLLGLFGGVIGFLGSSWTLNRKITQLEFDHFSLVERVNIEVKRRASAAGKRAREIDEAIIEAAAKTPVAAEPSLPWWAKMKPS